VKKKILIVDDDFDLLEQLKAILVDAGYDVTMAEGRVAAEEELLKMKPDLAITDLMMEERDAGFILSHKIKQLYPGTPLILLTSVASVTGLSFTAQNPDPRSWTIVDKIMDKPVRAEQIKEEIRKLLHEADEVH